MQRTCMVSVDVEEDLGRSTYKGVERLYEITNLFGKYHIRSTLFALGHIIEKNRELFREFGKKHEIASHGYTHTPLPEMDEGKRREELEEALRIHQEVFGERPEGYRAVQHNIDSLQMRLLEEFNFAYDSSVMPAYPPFKKYVGWKGPAPLEPYSPSSDDYRMEGHMKITELPVSGLALGIPLSGTWIRKLGPGIYRALLKISRPAFISLHMHSWDCAELSGPGLENTGEKFISYLDGVLGAIADAGYVFRSGDRIMDMLLE